MARSLEQVEAYWRGVLASGLEPFGGKVHREASQALRELPSSLSPALAGDVLALFAEHARADLWPAIAKLTDAHVDLLAQALQNRDDEHARLLVTAHAADGRDGLRQVAQFLTFVNKSSNVPAVLKRLPAFEASQQLRATALRFIDQTNAPGSLGTLSFWALAWLAAREDAAVLTRLERRAAASDIHGVLARVRAALATGAPSPQETPKPAAFGPTKVSEVSAWLKATSPVTPEVLARLARNPQQPTAQRAALIRTLAAIGGPEALAVLGSHGLPEQEISFPDPIARELIDAWSHFDRRAFARAVFGMPSILHLEDGAPLADLTGIDELKTLWQLKVRLNEGCDLSPLLGLPELRDLALTHWIGTEDIAVLARVPKLERLLLCVRAGSDLAGLEQLSRLQRVKLVLAKEPPDARAIETIGNLVRRGVDFVFFSDPSSQCVARALADLTVVEQSGSIALTSDAAREERLRMGMRMNSFPFLG